MPEIYLYELERTEVAMVETLFGPSFPQFSGGNPFSARNGCPTKGLGHDEQETSMYLFKKAGAIN